MGGWGFFWRFWRGRRAPAVSPNKADRCGWMPSMNSQTAASAFHTMSRDLLCIKMCVFVCFPSVADTPATLRLLPSASFRRHNCKWLIITVNHCRSPVVFFFARRQPPLCPCPPPPTPLSQISYSQAQRWRLETGERKRDSLLAWLEIVVRVQFGALLRTGS